MQPRTVRSRGNGMFFNWMASVILSLTLIALISPAPTFALSFSGSALLDWNSLTMTGIDFTLSNFSQLLQIQDSSPAQVFGGSNDWLPAAVSATLDPVGSGTATTSNIAVNSSLSLPVVSNDTFFIVGSARNVTITALDTGLLTVSIPYQIQDQGPISGEWFSVTSAGVQFTNPDHRVALRPGPVLSMLTVA